MNSINQGGQVLSDDQIADNIIGVFFAAQDTTASVMTWIIKYLHNDPNLLEVVKVRRALKTLCSNIIIFLFFFIFGWFQISAFHLVSTRIKDMTLIMHIYIYISNKYSY